MQILVVDDDPLLRQLLVEQLQFLGHEVFQAADGEAAWTLWQAQQLQFILTDWMMPQLDGPSLTRRVRRENRPRYTYIILLTARSDQEDINAGLEAGADDYLTKPFNLDELHARIAIGERILTLETRLYHALNRLQVMVTQDSLTGLLNRQAIMQQARIERDRAQRAANPVCFVMLDIDHFKAVNDTYGHLVGDQALRHVADTLRAAIRPYDYVGRWGGEEFLLLFPETTLDQALTIAERVRDQVADATLTLANGDPLPLRISLGITEVPPDSDLPLKAFLRVADEALYLAKNSGRDRVCSLPTV